MNAVGYARISTDGQVAFHKRASFAYNAKRTPRRC